MNVPLELPEDLVNELHPVEEKVPQMLRMGLMAAAMHPKNSNMGTHPHPVGRTG